ncbi:sorbose reductase [Microdochium nivale]|nr:sorbose reductase [Microdochium nivale]
MERAELTSRVIPTMTLSEGSSPLTAPLPSLLATTTTTSSPADRATARFAITGNAIVTGGAGDLGFTACRALLDHGLSGLVIFDRDPASATARVEQLRTEYPSTASHPRTISFATCNVADEAEVAASVQKVADDLGSVDILLAFAGVASCAHSLDVPAHEWRRVFDINTTGSFLCAQAVARIAATQTRRPASIVLVSSISGHTVNFPQPQAAYNASKAAVRVMAGSLAAEWARYGVRVNSISPGYMDTILNEGDGLKVARDTWTERNPMGRMGVPEELCGAVVLLASGAGRYITGADVVVDGGQTLF